MYVKKLLAALAFLTVLASCHHIDGTRIPPMPVNVSFTSQAQWETYGVRAAMDYRTFILADRHPASFPWTASTFTGFGGVLLVCDVLGENQAYDLACPVECKATTRVFVNEQNEAECPVCHSRYDVFSLQGYPIAGPAANNGWGLRRYRVGRGRTEYMVIGY